MSRNLYLTWKYSWHIFIHSLIYPTTNVLISLQNLSLEEQFAKTKAELEKSNNELSDVHTKFEGYKVRAQSVLRQKVKPDEPIGLGKEEGQEEIAQLRRVSDILRAKLEESR